MRAPRPSLHWLWRAFVLAVLVVAACSPDGAPEPVPAAAKKPVASPIGQPRARAVKGWQVRPLPTIATAGTDAGVTDAGAGQSNQAQTTPTDEGLDFEIDADPDIGRAPLTVQFAAASADGLPAPLSYFWEFGDGTSGEGNPVIHTYTAAGEYTATLTMADGAGRSATRDVPVQVDPRQPQGDGAE
jgi:hypothetical protein